MVIPYVYDVLHWLYMMMYYIVRIFRCTTLNMHCDTLRLWYTALTVHDDVLHCPYLPMYYIEYALWYATLMRSDNVWMYAGTGVSASVWHNTSAWHDERVRARERQRDGERDTHRSTESGRETQAKRNRWSKQKKNEEKMYDVWPHSINHIP